MNKKECKVAIIGGGFSGLLIAEFLQKKGYKNVTVFEKENRLGGKLHTIWYNGKAYEFGALFGLPNQKFLTDFIKSHNIKVDGPKLYRVNYDANGKRIMQIPKESVENFVEELNRLPDVLAHYNNIEDANIYNLDECLMLPFAKWCDVNNFDILKTIYTNYFTSYGLGDINVVPAIYVLKVMSYDNLMSFMELPHLYTWKEGVSKLINALEQQIKDIRLTQNVIKIASSKDNKVFVHTDFEVAEFDKVVLTTPLNQFYDFYNEDLEMQDFLRSIKYQDFNVYAFIVEKVPKKCGFVLDNLSSNKRGHIILWNSRWHTCEGEELVMVYAYNHTEKSKQILLKTVKQDLLKLGFYNPRLYQTKQWKHSPYVDTSTLQKGFYDKMTKIQGKNNLFLAGEIMSTISMENCIKYSKYLVDTYF
ncbi:MAG: FAD-dependent oxidoreductase [Vallitalea sp.]|jgi:protoporphyrinogen oxidase|nr:FAD-dependent oxidoreductase [Vallitalea sp.]